METLVSTLKSIGQPLETLSMPDGSRLLVLPHGGRMLGLFAPGSSRNFLWTNPVLQKPETAKAFYASDQWHNSGGDRTWLAPEADLFFPEFPSLKKYHQPRQLDPGQWRVVKDAGGLKLVNRLKVGMSRTGKTPEMEMSKSWAPAANPLRYERSAKELMQLEYAGYTQHTSLTLLGDASCQIGAWNLLQMPHGGQMLIPTYARTRPLVYFGEVAADDLVVSEHLVRYRMRAHTSHKISVRAVAVAGRMGYVYSAGDQQVLVMRNFYVDPSGEYVDIPWNDTNDFGYSTQACNVSEKSLGDFSELEYHIPAVGEGTHRTHCDDWSTVWAFRGTPELISAAAKLLLSPEA